MTEAEWLACADPAPMLDFVESRASGRKLRLFAVACCRRAWHLMTDPRHRDAIQAAERLADAPLTDAEVEAILEPVVDLWAALPAATANEWSPDHYMTGATRHLGTLGGARYAASYVARGLGCAAGKKGSPEWRAVEQAEEAAQCQLLRDLFGNPAFPFHFDPHWLSGPGRVAVERAGEVYRTGRFESLDGLADVLEQAGCRDRVVLEHCRGPGPHARGCWVVDALLERETAVRTGLVTEADWRTCADPTPLLHFLRDKGSIRKWRLFAVACCQRISHLMTDERSRRAVEIAAQYADGAAAEEELQAARSAAQEAQDDARAAEWRAEADANFGVTPAYAAACVHLRAASAARSAVCRDPRMADAEPGSPEASHWNPSHDGAAAAVNWNVLATFGSEQVDAAWRAAQSALGGEQQNAAWRAAQSAAESAETSELQAQCQLLRDLFAEYFGPPGEEGAWLTSGGAEGEHRPISPAERWCLLPTRRATTIRAEWLAWNDGTVRRIAQGIYEEGAFGRLPILADALLDAGCDDEELIAHCRQPGPHVRGCWAVDLILGKK